MTTEHILLTHASAYPQMRPTDAVKLLYQNEFGGGHMIADPEKSLRYLAEEYDKIPHDMNAPLTVAIGNGIVRVNLSALDIQTFSLEQLNDIFVESSRRVKGSLESFQEKLDLLIRLTEEGHFGFSLSELQTYLTSYAAEGYPAVSHSPEYRTAYAPAYRIVLEELLPSVR